MLLQYPVAHASADSLNPTPTLRPVRTRRATPYPPPASARSTNAARVAAPLLALPWYGVGGVPLQGIVEEVEQKGAEEAATADVEDAAAEESAAAALAALSLDAPPAFSIGADPDEEHLSRAQMRRAHRKRARDSARKLRRSLRLKEKEEASYEHPEDKAARVQGAKFDYSGASRRLRNALPHSYLISESLRPDDDDDNLSEIAAACGAEDDEVAGVFGEAAGPPGGQ